MNGRVEAITADQVPGGFRVLFALSGARRDRFVSRLAWLAGKNAKTAESRRHVRYEPKESSSSITLPDGRVYTCEVIDISLSGAAVKVDVVPSLGTHVVLGKMRGRVVRYLPTGIAIEFLRPLEQTRANRSANPSSHPLNLQFRPLWPRKRLRRG